MKTLLLNSLALALIATSPASAQIAQPAAPAEAPAPFSATEAAAVVEKLAVALDENFVFPEVGKECAAALRAKLKAGGYSNFADAKAFATAVTADLQAIHPDGHLRLQAPGPAASGERRMRRGPGTENTIEKAGWLAEGVAYISFTSFPGNEATLARLGEFLRVHSSAKTLIIDARRHGGGGLAEMDIIFPQLFDKAQLLVNMDTRLAVEQRRGSFVEEGVTLKRADGPSGVVRRSHWAVPTPEASGLRKSRVFLLTSKRTASAAEHLALSLKRTGRATLIGETTRGAGHYGNIEDLGSGYSAFIPFGRTFDPETGQGWEGKGVAPDVEVPAEQALDEALRRAGVAPDAAKSLASLS